MKYFYVFILILLIGFNACVREEITDINTIETEDPINVTGAFFKGKVYNGNIKIANAEIEVYENEKLVGKVFTNKDGQFNTAALKLENDKLYTLNVKKSGFPRQAKRRLGLKNAGDLEFNLQMNLDTLRSENVQLSPASNNLVVLTGYISDANMNPTKDALIFAYHDSIPHPYISNFYKYIGEFSVTDATGKYEILVPKDKVIHLMGYQQSCKSSEPPFYSGIPIFNLIVFKKLGFFNQNTNIQSFNTGINIENSIEIVDFAGTALNCSGEHIRNGQIKLQFHFDGNIKLDDNTQIINGKFKYKSSFCRPINRNTTIKILMKSIDAYNRQESDWIEVYNAPENFEDLNLVSCLPYDGPYYSFELKEYAISLPLGTGVMNDNLLRASQNWANVSNWFNFEIENPKLGENEIQRMIYNLNPNNLDQELIFIQGDHQITTNITNIENNTIDGTFEGKVDARINGNKTLEDVKGRFRIKI